MEVEVTWLLVEAAQREILPQAARRHGGVLPARLATLRQTRSRRALAVLALPARHDSGAWTMAPTARRPTATAMAAVTLKRFRSVLARRQARWRTCCERSASSSPPTTVRDSLVARPAVCLSGATVRDRLSAGTMTPLVEDADRDAVAVEEAVIEGEALDVMVELAVSLALGLEVRVSLAVAVAVRVALAVAVDVLVSLPLARALLVAEALDVHDGVVVTV